MEHAQKTIASILVACAATMCGAQPTITSLGNGSPSNVTNAVSGTNYIGGSIGRWALNGGSLTTASTGGVTSSHVSADGQYQIGTLTNAGFITGNSVATVSPAWSIPSSFTTVTLPTGNSVAARYSYATSTWTKIPGIPNDAYSQSLGCFGSGDSGNVMTPHRVSSTGRFIVGQGYISTYNSTGTAIAGTNTFRTRPWICDMDANGGAGATRLLFTPYRSGSPTQRRRDGSAFDVSADGSVVVGAQDFNVSTGSAPDPDGARLVVWRWNGSDYVMSFLPNGVDGSGNPITASVTASDVHMNDAGTIIIGKGVDLTGSYLAKWTWDTGTNTWSNPQNLGRGLTNPPSWGTFATTPVLYPTGLSEDGNTVIGANRYQNLQNQFVASGFIWKSEDGVIVDWYDYLSSLNTTPNIPTYYRSTYAYPTPPDYPALGVPTGISSDGSTIVGGNFYTNAFIIGAMPWIVKMSGGASCTAPSITLNPAATAVVSKCSSAVILNSGALGTYPLTYQWFKDNVPVSNGGPSSITGATEPQMRITYPNLADAGTYWCVVTGCNSGTATTTNCVVSIDPANTTPPANDTCSTPQAVGEGTFTFNMCSAWTTDGYGACAATTTPETADVWFRYTPTFTGWARLQTCASTFNTNLQIMDGCAGGTLACADNVDGRGYVGLSGCGANSTRAVISSYPVTQGVPVLIRVGAVGAPTSTGSLVIGPAPAAPVNDSCLTPTDVGLGTYAFNLAEATEDNADGCTGGNTSSTRDVWFRLVSPCGGTYTIDTCGLATTSSISNPMLHVYDSCGGVAIACNDNAGSGVCTVGGSNQARILNLTITGDVLIRVSASGTSVPSFGNGQINISGTTNCCITCDYNDDGGGDNADVTDLANAIASDTNPYPFNCKDFNQDGGADNSDVTDLANAIAGGTCPQ